MQIALYDYGFSLEIFGCFVQNMGKGSLKVGDKRYRSVLSQRLAQCGELPIDGERFSSLRVSTLNKTNFQVLPVLLGFLGKHVTSYTSSSPFSEIIKHLFFLQKSSDHLFSDVNCWTWASEGISATFTVSSVHLVAAYHVCDFLYATSSQEPFRFFDAFSIAL